MFNLNYKDNKTKISLNEELESESYSDCNIAQENSIKSFDFVFNENPAFHLEEEEKLNISFEEENKSLAKNLYFIEALNEGKKLFKLIKKDSKEEIISTNHSSKKRKRGKAKKKDNNRTHNPDSADNLLRKIQVHYLSFIISFLNDLLNQLNYKQRFKNIDYTLKKKIDNKYITLLKRKSINEIITETIISKKYKSVPQLFNEIIYNEIRENKILNEILSQNYLNLFQKIYFKSDKIIDLEEYGFSKIIYLSDNVKMFKDLLFKDSQNLSNNNYLKKMYQCVKKNFFPKLIFAVLNRKEINSKNIDI